MSRISSLPAPFAPALAFALLLTTASSQHSRAEEHAPQSDLTLSNFFTAGWGEAYVHPERASGTPDMALLRVTTNFLEREFRLDYVHTNGLRRSRFSDTDAADALMAYAIDRRWMVEVVTNYQWNTPITGPGVSGANGAILGRLQLVDTALTSLSAQVRVTSPNRSLGATQTSTQYVLAGFNDLFPLLGLYRTGLYYSLTYEALLGNHARGAIQNDVIYDVSLAKTWTTMATPVFGNFTTFVELNATTDLDGFGAGNKLAGHTIFTVTPGTRFWLIPRNSLMFGVDLPANHPNPFGYVFRGTYILNF